MARQQQKISTEPSESHAPRGGGFSSSLLFFLGSLCAASGIVVVTAPYFSWQVTKVTRKVTELGFESGELVTGGFILLAIGLLVRSSGKRQPVSDERVRTELAEMKLLVEQQLSDSRQVRTSVGQVASQVTALSESQNLMHQTLESQQGSTEANGQDALFRLAASLDQLTARVDERFGSLTNHVNEGLQHVSHRTGEALNDLQSKLESLAQPARHAVAHSAPAPSRPAAHGAHGASAHKGRQAREQQEPAVDFDEQQNSEFFQTLSDLDALVSEPQEEEPLDFDQLELDEPAPRSPLPRPTGGRPAQDLDAFLPPERDPKNPRHGR
jgi:hypothetical protein